MHKKQITGFVTKTGENKYKVLASTSAIDRQGDSIDQSGWDLTNFKKNPVMPWAHDYGALPVAKATSVEVTVQGLETEFEFAPAEGNPMAQQVKVLYDQGYLNAVSVGFIPKMRKGNVITSAELLEISFVPVPANQEALRLAAKSIEDGTVKVGNDVREAVEFMLKAIDKGAVADELSAEEAMDAKYENLDAVFEVVYAMCHVYCLPETSVDSFPTLLSETVGLLQNLADGEMTDEEKAKTAEYKDIAHKAVEAIVEKAGRTISKETMGKIETAINHIKNGFTVLEQLKTDSAQSGDGETSKAVEVVIVEDNSILLSADDLAQMRKAAQINIRQNEFFSSMVKNFLEKRAA